jgi:hypothetical protein
VRWTGLAAAAVVLRFDPAVGLVGLSLRRAPGRVLRCVGVGGYRVPMSAEASSSGPVSPPFADASPAQVRAALSAEDAAAFDRQWRRLMARATETLDLAEVHQALEDWRRVAWLTSELGPEGYRRMLATAEERLRTGERAEGAVPWNRLKAELGLAE